MQNCSAAVGTICKIVLHCKRRRTSEDTSFLGIRFNRFQEQFAKLFYSGYTFSGLEQLEQFAKLFYTAKEGEQMKTCRFWVFVSTVFMVFAVFPAFQALGQDDPLSESLETQIDEEFKWLQEEAQAVFVTVATKTAMTVQEAPSIVSVITGEQIRNMGARDIIDVLRIVPGFDLNYFGSNNEHRVYVRGMGSALNEKIKIMINGHSLYAFAGTDPDVHFDKIPIHSIKRIEIIRGPGSAIYGTGAFLGIINIITRQGGDEPSRISLGAGSFNTADPYAELSYKDGDIRAYLYADCFRTDGYDGIVESDMATVTPGFSPSASRELTSETEHYTFQSNISYKDFHFSGFFQKVMDTNSPMGVYALTDENDIESFCTYGTLEYRRPIADRGSLLIKAYYDYADYKAEFEDWPEETAALFGAPPGEGLLSALEGNWSAWGAEITPDYKPHPGVHLMGGASYEHVGISDVDYALNYDYFTGYYPGGLTSLPGYDDADRAVTAAYLQGIFDLKKLFFPQSGVKNLTLTIGGRHDHYDDVGSSTNPRFGIVYAPGEKLWFKALYGKAFRAPSLMELKYMDQSLIPERIATVEGLVGYHFTKNISASITGFSVSTEELIQIITSYQNIGSTESYGAEAEFKAAFGKNRYAYLNFTWQDVKDTAYEIIPGTDPEQRQDDFHPGSTPEFYANIGLNYGFTEKIVSHISLNCTGEKKRSEAKKWDGGKLVRGDARDPVEERWLLNASLRFRDIPAKGMEIQISGFNLLDEDHRDPYGATVQNDIPRPGRTFAGRISYSF